MRSRQVGILLLLCTAAALSGRFSLAQGPRGAEPKFVGVLALALESADKLMLSDEQKQQLLKIIDERENKALPLAVGLKDLSAADQEEKLGPFRKASEAAGLAILSEEQRERLEQIRLQRAGAVALSEEMVAEKLKLTGEQQAQVEKLVAERDTEMARVSDRFKRGVRDRFERRLVETLDEAQKTQWSKLTGLAAAAQPAPQAEPEATSNDAQPAAAARPAAPKGDGKLRFNFQHAAWSDVLNWFAEQADLSLEMEAPPPGTFNYRDGHNYTPSEAIDLLNYVLLTKGYTLVKRNRMLMLINLEDGIPPNLISDIPLKELDQKGEFELVSVVFRLDRITPDEAEIEIRPVLGPQGKIDKFQKAGLVRVTETAGRLKMIRSVLARIDPAVLQSMENTDAAGTALRVFTTKHQQMADVLGVVRQLMGIPPDAYASEDGSIRMALDPATGKLLVTGKPDKVAKMDEILKVIDVPSQNTGTAASAIIESPQFEVYGITAADPNSVLAVLQTLLAPFPDVRLALDPKTGHLNAYARPAQHRTILATLNQMQRDSRKTEVIPLKRVEPQTAMEIIKQQIGADGMPGTAPIVTADTAARVLYVRASEAHLAQIRALLEKMGEPAATGSSLPGAAAASSGGTMRMLPAPGRAVRGALEEVEQVWSTMRGNRIRVVPSTSGLPTRRPAEVGPGEALPRIRDTQLPAETERTEPATDNSEDRNLPPLPSRRERQSSGQGGARAVRHPPPTPSPLRSGRVSSSPSPSQSRLSINRTRNSRRRRPRLRSRADLRFPRHGRDDHRLRRRGGAR